MSLACKQVKAGSRAPWRAILYSYCFAVAEQLKGEERFGSAFKQVKLSEMRYQLACRRLKLRTFAKGLLALLTGDTLNYMLSLPPGGLP